MKHIVNFIMYDILLFTTSKFLWRSNDWLWGFAVSTVISLITYIIWIKKLSDKTLRTSISIIITFGLNMLYNYFVITLHVPAIIFVSIFSVLVLILVFLAKIAYTKKLKIDYNYIMKEIIYITKYVLALVISFAIGIILVTVFKLKDMLVPVLFFTYIFNYIFNKLGKEEKMHDEEIATQFNIFIVLAIIEIIVIGYIVINITNYIPEIL